jgi:hypothetical protein
VSAPTLVLLAAGLGSRYGGLKQFDPIGPGGTTLMDYGLFDAWRAGFGRAVFVLGSEMTARLMPDLVTRYGGKLAMEAVTQRPDDLPHGFQVPADRSRPWGTTQAVLAAAPLLHGPFAVLNSTASMAGMPSSRRGIPPRGHPPPTTPLSVTHWQ